MKSRFTILMAIPLFTLMACTSEPKSDIARTSDAISLNAQVNGDEFLVDTSTSSMEWIGTKISTYHHGVVRIKSGTIVISAGAIAGGKFIVDMTSIAAYDKGVAGVNEKLTSHLKTGDFFDVTNYPSATFEITGVKKNKQTLDSESTAEELNKYKVANPNFMISGNLTIKNVTKNIEFPAEVAVNDHRVSAIAKFNIDRRLWGITYPGMPDDLIGDMIWFGISLQGSSEEDLKAAL